MNKEDVLCLQNINTSLTFSPRLFLLELLLHGWVDDDRVAKSEQIDFMLAKFLATNSLVIVPYEDELSGDTILAFKKRDEL